MINWAKYEAWISRTRGRRERDIQVTAEYLLEIFCDLTELTANITPGYLLDWQKLIGINLTSWEAETILRMFSSYMIELRKKGGSDPLEEYSEKEVRMANTIRGFLSGRG